jgi:spore germination protein YaaH
LQGETVQWGKAAEAEEPVPMRSEPTIKAPIVADLAPGEQVMIWSDTDEWYRVQRQNGTMGYAKKKEIRLDRIETVPLSAEPPPFVPWKPLGGKINMTWEHVVTRNPDPSKIGPMPGLNVISPTWFSIIDGEGNLKNLADASYVKWAHSRGYQVWALFSNGFDADVTTAALATYDKRMKMIRQLLAYAQMYQLDGINIDFEYVYLKDKDRLTQFVREMTPMFHEQGLVVSIDVTFKSTSEMWSMFYDRKALAEVVDYMMVMAYDEHPAASPVSGSVSSLPWVEKGIVRILQEDQVPPSKLVLGIPYYTRIWTEQTVNGKKEVSSRAVFMETAQQQLSERGVKPQYDPETGQNYAEYTEGGKRIRVWLEDETSLAARLEIVKKYDLAGIASWRRGYETPNIWEFIENHMNKRP